jgi:PAS domain S-box-containing protein
MMAQKFQPASMGEIAAGEAAAWSAVARISGLERESDLHQLLEALPVAVYTTDAEGRLTFYNKAAVELSGHSPVLGRDHWCVSWRLYRPDGTPLPHDQCPMALTLKTGKALEGVELVVERPDGGRCPVLTHPTPLHDATGRLTGAVNMLVDISERRSAQMQQRALVRELNHRVKNNMQMLHALLDMARRESRSEEARVVLADAGRRVGAIAAAQKVLYETHTATMFEGRHVLEAVCENARRSLGKGIEIALTAAPGQLSNDTATPLALILSELLTNALTHGLAGRAEGKITVSLAREGEGFCLRVEDDGPGFTLGESHKSSSGLGLVSGLARQLGGSLTVTGSPGACCRIRFFDRHRT